MATRFAEPARRMYDDAEALLAQGRLGTPDHLYGLACECALKAILAGMGIIQSDPPQKPFKTHADTLWQEFNAALSGRSATALALGPANPFTGWSVNDRYLDDSQFSQARVRGHQQGARCGMRALELATMEGIVR